MPDDPKSLLRRFYDEVNAGNLDAMDELLADDVVEHEELPGLEPNKEGVKQFFAMLSAMMKQLGALPEQAPA